MNVREIYESLDYDFGDVTSRLTDDEAFIARILIKFSEDENISKLEKALGSEDYNEAYEAAHAIKGLSSNMGFLRNYELALKLSEKLKASEHDGLDELFEELKGENDRVLDAISKLE